MNHTNTQLQTHQLPSEMRQMRFRSLWRKGKQQKDRLARLLTEGAALFLLLQKNTLLYTVELYSSRDPKFGRLSIVS
jgi:hypothetical protein